MPSLNSQGHSSESELMDNGLPTPKAPTNLSVEPPIVGPYGGSFTGPRTSLTVSSTPSLDKEATVRSHIVKTILTPLDILLRWILLVGLILLVWSNK